MCFGQTLQLKMRQRRGVTLVILDVMKTLEFALLLCMVTELSQLPAEIPAVALWQGLALPYVRAQFSFSTNTPLYLGDNEPNNCETLVQSVESDQATVVLFGGTTKSKALSWKDNTVTDCYTDQVGYVSLINGTALYNTIIFPGKPGDLVEQVGWIGFPQQYTGSSKDINFFTAFVTTTQHQVAVGIQLINMTVVTARVLPGKETRLHDNNMVHYLQSSSAELAYNNFAWGIQSTLYPNQFAIAEMSYAYYTDYYVRTASFQSPYGVTALDFYSTYLYIGGSAKIFGGTDRFGPVFGYGARWTFRTRRLQKIGDLSNYNNLSIDRIFLTRKDVSTGENFAFFLARQRANDGQFSLLPQSNFLVVQCFDHTGGTFGNGEDCVIRELKLFGFDEYITIDSMFMVPNGATHDIGFIFFTGADYQTFSNRTGQQGVTKVVVAKVQNLHSLHMNGGTLEQNQPLQRTAYGTYPLCKWGRLARVVMTSINTEDALLVCASTDYGATSINGGSKAVVIEKLDPSRITGSNGPSSPDTDVLDSASSSLTNITQQMTLNSELAQASNTFPPSNLIKSHTVIGQTYTKYLNQSLNGQLPYHLIPINYLTHGTGYFSAVYWQPTVSLIHADAVSPIPTTYNENLPYNYTDLVPVGNLNLNLNFTTIFPKSWEFYIMLKNPFQQFVIPNTYIIEVAACTSNSATVTSVPATEYFEVYSDTFSSTYENITFTTFSFSAHQSKCGFQKYVLTASSSSYLTMPTTYIIDQQSETTANVLVINKALDNIYTGQVTGYATNNNLFATLNLTVRVKGPCRYSVPQIPTSLTFGPIKYLLGAPLQQVNVNSAFINHITNNNTICYIDRNHLFPDPTPGTDYTAYFVSPEIYLSGTVGAQFLNVKSTIVSDYSLLMRARPRTLDRWVDMPFRVFICEITSITAAAPKRIVEQYDPSPAGGLPDNIRYYSEDYATLLGYFTTVPTSPHPECTNHQLKLTTDAILDIQYLGTGIELDVAQTLKVDRTLLGAGGKVFLQAKFMATSGPTVSAHMMIDFEVCSQTAITKSSPTATIEMQIKKYSTTSPLVDVQIIPDSDLLAIFSTSCSLCPLIYFKVLTQADADYTNPDLQYDGPNGGLAVKTDLAMRRQVKLQAVADPTTQADCSFIQPVEIPIDIAVCGDETITLTQPGPLQLSLEPGYDPDASFTYNDLTAMILISNYCRLDTIQLSVIGTSPPSTNGAPWVSYIFLDPNNDLKINFNGNVPSNTTHNVSIWFTTTGGVTQVKQLDLEFYLRNKPPSLIPPILAPQTFSVSEEQKLLGQLSNFEFISQAATDPENDVIDFELSNNLPCNCASISVYNTYHFNLTIDVYNLKATDSGTTTLTIIAKDDASLTVNTYTLDITLVWEPYDNPAPYLESPIGDIILIVNKNNVIENGIYTRMFTSEVLDDDLDPTDIIAMEYVIQDKFDCGCVEMMLLANHSIKIDIYMPTMTEKDAGLHLIDLNLNDNATAHNKSYQFYIDVRFVDIPLFVAPTDDDEKGQKASQEFVIEEEVVEEEVVKETEEVEEEEDDIQIDRPVVKPFKNPFALSKKVVTKIFNGFKPPPNFLVEEEEHPEVKLSIVSISRNALLTIKPNQPCYRPSFLDPLNTTRRILISYDEIDVGRDLIDFSFILNSEEEQKDIQFSLTLVDWQEEFLKVQVNFTDPLIISKGLNLDQVLCRVRRRDLFVSKLTGKVIPPENKYFADRIPKQLPFGVSEEDIKANAMSTSSSVKAMVFFQLIIQICLKGSLNELWTLFFTLQIICYLDYYDVPIPANAEIYLEEVTKLIEFDVLNPEGIIKLFNPDFNLKAFMLEGQVSLTSVNEPYSVLDDLKVFIFIIILAPIVITLLLLLTVFRGLRTKIKELMVDVFNGFMFNGLIRSFIIAYIQMCLSAGHQIRLLLKGDDQITVSSIFSAFCMEFATWASVVLLAKLLLHYQDRLEEPKIKKRISILYADIRTKNGVYSLMYYPLFLLRRVIFILLPTIWYMYPFLQIQLLIFLTSLYIAWYSGERPHRDHKRHKLEVFNEVMIMVVNYHVISFTKFNIDPPTQFIMGYSLVLTVFIVIFVNIGLLVYKMVNRGMYTIGLKRFREQLQKNQRWLADQYYIEYHIKLLTEQEKVNDAERMTRLEEEKESSMEGENSNDQTPDPNQAKQILNTQYATAVYTIREASGSEVTELKGKPYENKLKAITWQTSNIMPLGRRTEQPVRGLRPIKRLTEAVGTTIGLTVIEEDQQDTLEDITHSPMFIKRSINQVNLNSPDVEGAAQMLGNINFQQGIPMGSVWSQAKFIEQEESKEEIKHEEPEPALQRQHKIKGTTALKIEDEEPEPALQKQHNLRRTKDRKSEQPGLFVNILRKQRNIKKSTPKQEEQQ